VLLAELSVDAESVSDHDFGKNIIPQMITKGSKVMAYNFGRAANQSGYWRDIGTRDAYYEANMDLLGPEPQFNLYDRQWRVRTYHEQYPPAKIVSVQEPPDVAHGRVINAIISGGCVIEGGVVEHSVLSPNVYVKPGAEVRHSILMEGVVVGRGAKIQNAIIDKNATIPDGEEIGFDLILDRKRFDVTSSGIVIVAKRTALSASAEDNGHARG
jgi:glucose-1-phosphate adenylyltransferase